MKKTLAIFSMLFLMAMTSRGQKLWEKVYSDSLNNYSSIAGSMLVNDTLIVINGFRDQLNCNVPFLRALNVRGEETWVVENPPAISPCTSANCHGTFDEVVATESYIYSSGKAGAGDIVTGDEPLFLYKYDLSGYFVYAKGFHGGESWGSGVLDVSAMIANEESGVIVAFETSLLKGLIKFNPQGEMLWVKNYNHKILDMTYTKEGEFAILTPEQIFRLSSTGEIVDTFDLQTVTGDQLIYLDHFFYFTYGPHIFRLDIETGDSEVIFSAFENIDFHRINLANDSIWSLSSYSVHDDASLVNVFDETPLKYTLPVPAMDIHNFLVSKDEIILAGNTLQKQIMLVAYSRADVAPLMLWPEVELVDFKIYDVEYLYTIPFSQVYPSHISFNTQLTIKNNDSHTLNQVSVQSNRFGGYNSCAMYYVYFHLEDINLEPQQELVVELGKTYDYYKKWEDYNLCYQLLAPNSAPERFIGNNSICKNYDFITNVPETLMAQKWKIYPNPVSGHIFIESDYPGSYFIRVYSAEGRLMMSGFQEGMLNRLEITGFPQGIYFLQIQRGDEIHVEKFLKR